MTFSPQKFTVLDSVECSDLLEGKLGNSSPASQLMGMRRMAKEKARMMNAVNGAVSKSLQQLTRLLVIDMPI
ncbi:hypothetical protein RchiOBHm_Chr7g0232561 [Rosa chinensis]|uniref:Uncharacterized protein n=1 Tax=Rosa chinensis TaxID=74649 RepID=A0A2P6PFY5_ROSCH|nr:hypothetical protein RchiOBHm_Chr7g0232561 [Rosa chinensis]